MASVMEDQVRRIAETVLWDVETRPRITTHATPDVQVGDWFRVALVARRDDETVVTLVQVAPDDSLGTVRRDEGITGWAEIGTQRDRAAFLRRHWPDLVARIIEEGSRVDD